MVKTSLIFNLIGSQKVEGACALTREAASSPCSDGKRIAQALKGGNSFFHPSLSGTMVGDLLPLNHLC